MKEFIVGSLFLIGISIIVLLFILFVPIVLKILICGVITLFVFVVFAYTIGIIILD